MLVWLGGKDVAENPLPFDIDWTARLAGDTISSAPGSSTWTFTTTDGQLTIQSDSHTTTRTQVWLIGGTVGFNYELQNQVTTATGAKPVENVQLLCKHR